MAEVETLPGALRGRRRRRLCLLILPLQLGSLVGLRGDLVGQLWDLLDAAGRVNLLQDAPPSTLRARGRCWRRRRCRCRR